MTLSISDSKKAVSHKKWAIELVLSFLISLVLVGAVDSFITKKFWWAKREIQIPAINNAVKLEKYIYTQQNPKIVIVGSSICDLLPPEGISDPDIFTLNTAGTCGLTGLEVIRRCKTTPKLILIESDFITRPIDKLLINKVFQSPFFNLKKYFPILRYENNLANLIFKSKTPPLPIPPPINETKDAWNLKIQPKIDFYLNDFLSEELSEKYLILQASTLKQQIQELEKRGCKIAFFNTPICDPLLNSPYFKNYHSRLYNLLPDIPVIQFSSECPYYTVDGIHLTIQSGVEFYKFLVKEGKRMLNQNYSNKIEP